MFKSTFQTKTDLLVLVISKVPEQNTSLHSSQPFRVVEQGNYHVILHSITR